MSSEALQRLRQATHRREELRRAWDQARNRDLLGLLLLTLPPLFGAERGGLFVLDPTNRKLWLEAGTGVAERAAEWFVRYLELERRWRAAEERSGAAPAPR